MFTNQLEKSREATDEANIRSLYAETVAGVLGEDTTTKTSLNGATLVVTNEGGIYKGVATYKLAHQKDGLEGRKDQYINIGGCSLAANNFKKGGVVTITVLSDGSLPTFTF